MKKNIEAERAGALNFDVTVFGINNRQVLDYL